VIATVAGRRLAPAAFLEWGSPRPFLRIVAQSVALQRDAEATLAQLLQAGWWHCTGLHRSIAPNPSTRAMQRPAPKHCAESQDTSNATVCSGTLRRIQAHEQCNGLLRSIAPRGVMDTYSDCAAVIHRHVHVGAVSGAAPEARPRRVCGVSSSRRALPFLACAPLSRRPQACAPLLR